MDSPYNDKNDLKKKDKYYARFYKLKSFVIETSFPKKKILSLN
jgi:hypothetical protein